MAIFRFTALTALLLFMAPGLSRAQAPRPHRAAFCAADLVHTRHLTDPDYRRQWQDFERQRPPSAADGATPVTLPVVVHVIHDNGPENIPDAQVQTAIAQLNAAFANTGYYDQGNGVDTDIRFCLAQRTPAGAATGGVTRTVSALTDMVVENDDDALKNLVRWAPTQYINIWIVRSITSTSAGAAVAGYALLPAAHGGVKDGIVFEAAWFGSAPGNTAALVHEMGHYLGLYHTFHSTCGNDDCQGSGDRVCDTPPDASTAAVPCDAVMNSCTTDVNPADPDNPFTTDQPDMIANYLDYGHWDCYNAFTPGQATRMQFFLQTTRASLLSSPGCLPACTTPLTASFTAPAGPVFAGTTVSFTNTSIGPFTSVQWHLDGVAVAGQSIFTHTFPTPGEYSVALTIANAAGNCFETYSTVIEVVCAAQASFLPAASPSPDTPLTYLNTSTGGGAYTWRVGGAIVSTSNHLVHTFPTPGLYEVCLTVETPVCSSESCQWVLAETAGDSCAGGTFLRHYGHPWTSNTGLTIVPSGDGGFFIGGSQTTTSGPRGLLLKVAVDGTLLWVRTLEEVKHIRGLLVDSDGMLVIHGAGIDYTIMRYDVQADTFAWYVKTGFNFHVSGSVRVFERAPGGPFIVTYNQMTGCLVALDRETGAVLPGTGKRYLVTAANRFHDVQQYGGYLYGIGSVGVGNSGTQVSKEWLFKIDPQNGQLVWQRFFESPAGTAGNYESYLDIGPDAIVVATWIPYTSFNATNGFFLQKFTPGGLPVWNKRFFFQNGWLRDLAITPDGLLVTGRWIDSIDYNFILKTDVNGNVQWGRQVVNAVPTWDEFTTPQALYVAGDAFFATGRFHPVDSGDVWLARLPTNGVIPPGCPLLVPFTQTPIALSVLPDTVNNFFVLSHSAAWPPEATLPQMPISALISSVLCEPDCPSCENTGDARVQLDSLVCHDGIPVLYGAVCNPAGGDLAAGLPVALYAGSPFNLAAALVDTLVLPAPTPAGTCQVFEWALTSAPAASAVLYAVANDDGSLTSPFQPPQFPPTGLSECNVFNNLDSVVFVYPPTPALQLGADTVLCSSAVVTLTAPPGFDAYRWHDGSSETTITVTPPGIYWLEATNVCGGRQRDTIAISVDATTVIDLADSTICVGGSVAYAVPGFAAYQWSPATGVDCPSCGAVTITPDAPTTYTLVGTTTAGCLAVDTVRVDLAPVLTGADTALLCAGDTLGAYGLVIDMPGDYPVWLTTAAGCDSLLTLSVVPEATSWSVTLPDTVEMLIDQSVVLQPVVTGGVTPVGWQWTPATDLDNAAVFAPTATPRRTRRYRVTAIAPNGCRREASVVVHVREPDCAQRVYAPTAFMPAAAEPENAAFGLFPAPECVRALRRLQVYDRWGTLLFDRRDDASARWDGRYRDRLAPPGVYVWYAEIELYNGEILRKKGEVTLVY